MKTMQSKGYKLPFWNKLAYGIGCIPYGVKDSGFSYFVLIYYSQVLGVPAQWVGLALFLAMLCDAITDPLVGYWSDNLHSRWGRRHPFMYAAALPIAFSYYFLWSPPSSLSDGELFIWLTLFAIFIRTLITLYEVPSSAMSAEMTDDYDERTSILSLRQSFAWIGGTVVASIGLAVFLVPTESIARGIMNVDGYHGFAIMASCVIFTTMMIGALGTHSLIPHLHKAPPKSPMSIKRTFSEIFETLSDRDFIAIFLTTLIGATATGVSAGLNYYINNFYWEFTTEQVSLLQISVIISAIFAIIVAPFFSKKMGKKRAAIILGMVAFTTAPMPVALRLLDIMPVNGDPILFPIIFALAIIDLTLIIAYLSLMQSMVADVVEASQLRTKRRSEGVLFAANTFARKFSQGSGVMIAAILLAIIDFPREVSPGDVPADKIFNLGLIYAPIVFILWMSMMLMLTRYRIDRSVHAKNLESLSAQN